MSGTVLNLRQNTTVVTGATLSGELTDTSDLRKKYDIKSIEHNFTDIVKQIEPKTFKMKDEKEIGINRNHIGFIADEIESVMPKDFENIVMENDEGIKQLNYVKLSSVLWGAVKEQQTKIEHLEATTFEVMEEIKEMKKPKPKARPKRKSKDKSDSED